MVDEEKIIKGLEEKQENTKNPEKEISKEKSKPEEAKKENKKKNKVETPKKDLAAVNARDLPISTKQAMAICKFVLKKSPERSVEELEQVIKMNRAVPMKGELPHRKGMMSGRYPIKSTKIFLKLIRQLQANAEVNRLEEPIIIDRAISNVAARPMRRSGSSRFKRTHVTLIAKEKNTTKTESIKEKK